MASRESLKSELAKLQEIFPKGHERFQIVQAVTDQLTCRFIDENGKKYDIHANIPDDYPSTPVLWYTDSDEASVEEIVENLGSTNQDKSILNQVDTLLRDLCRLHKIKMPNEATVLLSGESSSGTTSGMASGSVAGSANVKTADSMDQSTEDPSEAGYASDGDSSSSSMDSDNYESISEFYTKSPSKKSTTDDDPPIKKAHLDVLKKIKTDSSGSNTASSRLMKEMMEIYRSDSYKNGEYTIELVDDSIYNWNIELRRCIDSDSELYKDLIKLKEKEGKDSVVINITFDDKYPIEPPFVRVVYPIVKCIHVTIGGAFCTALLLKQCWSPAYTIESVIVQMAALLVRGNARICFDSPIKYSLSAAKNTFDGVMSRKQTGWYDQDKESS